MTTSRFPVPSTTARALGLAGLLPFVAGAAALAMLQVPGLQAWAGTALVAYAALIATFLGGIHWGLAMQDVPPVNVRLGWGISPSLLAWVAVLLPPSAGLVVLAALLVACYVVDRRLYASAGLSRWLGLRLQLTAVATASCLAGAWAMRQH
ncbi:DUF3429 domain-containing protein [Polaromonas sp. CG_9.11]|uniref:DUF3429 domain-containing protein n=1 Tax=Polaromonas sp. CG_9.11 TaxID=2787730 RepID=UPI0018CB0599|nr:DUF3429 domain-containing protein [Polaromonas sp. CG_9.11]MBG6077055.1 hypothetical protein [Polaromonas sp. CG_9.11]